MLAESVSGVRRCPTATPQVLNSYSNGARQWLLCIVDDVDETLTARDSVGACRISTRFVEMRLELVRGLVSAVAALSVLFSHSGMAADLDLNSAKIYKR